MLDIKQKWCQEWTFQFEKTRNLAESAARKETLKRQDLWTSPDLPEFRVVHFDNTQLAVSFNSVKLKLLFFLNPTKNYVFALSREFFEWFYVCFYTYPKISRFSCIKQKAWKILAVKVYVTTTMLKIVIFSIIVY